MAKLTSGRLVSARDVHVDNPLDCESSSRCILLGITCLEMVDPNGQPPNHQYHQFKVSGACLRHVKASLMANLQTGLVF